MLSTVIFIFNSMHDIDFRIKLALPNKVLIQRCFGVMLSNEAFYSVKILFSLFEHIGGATPKFSGRPNLRQTVHVLQTIYMPQHWDRRQTESIV